MTVRKAIALLVLALALVATSCAGRGAGPPFELTAEVVAPETSREIGVFAPEAPGPWPVVYLLHGMSGDPHEMDLLATKLAAEGTVVFNVDWDLGGDLLDLACAYRYGQSIAGRYGGDADRSVAVGYSAGATFALLGATSTEPDVPAADIDQCRVVDGGVAPPAQLGVPMPDVLVMVAPCLFQYEEQTFDTQPAGGNTDLHITVVSGERDEVCAPWQQHDAVELLRDAGYATQLVTLASADHRTLIEDAVEQTAAAVLQAIAATWPEADQSG